MNSCGIHGNFLWKGCAKVIIEHQGQALTVAMEMERRAIRTYERALLLAKDEEVRKGIEDILGDERRHLKRFTEMWDKTVNSAEQQVLLQAMAADVEYQAVEGYDAVMLGADYVDDATKEQVSLRYPKAVVDRQADEVEQAGSRWNRILVALRHFSLTLFVVLLLAWLYAGMGQAGKPKEEADTEDSD